MDRITVLLVEPLEKPRLVTVEHTLENLQELVGGYIAATYPWDDRIGLVCADEGIDLGFPLNRVLIDEQGKVYDIIHGTFFLCGFTTEDFTSIPDKLVRKYMRRFRYPEFFFRTLDEHVYCVRLGADDMPIRIV